MPGRPNRPPVDLAEVEAGLIELLAPYRDRLELFTLYGVEFLRAPGASAHDWFAGVRRASRHVSFFLLPVHANPGLLDDAPPELVQLRGGASVFNVRALDPVVVDALAALLARAWSRYEADHPPTA